MCTTIEQKFVGWIKEEEYIMITDEFTFQTSIASRATVGQLV